MKDFITSTLLGAVIGGSIGFAGYTITSTLQNSLKVGECVRELGYSNLARVTAVAPSGQIELTFNSDYKDSYDEVAQERLIKVECTNE